MSIWAKQSRTILEIPCIATPLWSLIQLRSCLGDNSPKHVFFQIYNHNIVIIMQTCNHFFELKKSNNTPLWYLDYQSSNYPWWTVGQYKNIKVTFLSYPTQQDTSHPLSMSSIVSSDKESFKACTVNILFVFSFRYQGHFLDRRLEWVIYIHIYVMYLLWYRIAVSSLNAFCTFWNGWSIVQYYHLVIVL